MEASTIMIFNEMHIDYPDLLTRLGNSESIAKKFLKRFIDDETFTKITQAYDNHDYEELLRNVHSLKGVAGNLSMHKLYNICNTWVMDLRAQNFQTSAQQYQQCFEEYHHIMKGLVEFFKE